MSSLRAGFTVTDTHPLYKNQTIHFDAGTSSDPDNNIASWEGDFGDGSQPVEGEPTTHQYDPVAGETITFDGVGSSDPDGQDLTYSWDTDGDGTEDYSGESVQLYFNTLDDYEDSLTVTDTSNANDSTTGQSTKDCMHPNRLLGLC